MKTYRVLFFDLDGTITDPAIGITNSVIYALKKFGITAESRSGLYKFIGPPLADSFENFCGFSKKQAKEAVGYYREYYADRGIFENRVYDGCEDMLKRLSESGKTLAVATSKPEIFAKRILDHFSLSRYFFCVAGADLEGRRVKKDEVIADALDACAVMDKSRAIMIGDTRYDIEGARKAGIDSLGVLYGYGSRVELEAAGASYLAETVADIADILLDR